MKLGILVNTDRHLGHVLGIARAALAQQHEVSLFLMDTGTQLALRPELAGLAAQPGVVVTLCDHSAQAHGIEKTSLPASIACRSQVQNALMNHRADRVLVL